MASALYQTWGTGEEVKETDKFVSNNSDGGDRMVNYLTLKDKDGNISNVILGYAEDGAEEHFFPFDDIINNTGKGNLPIDPDKFNDVYNDGLPYSDHKPCDYVDADGNILYFNQCAIRASAALKKTGIDLSSAEGARCIHGDILAVNNVAAFLQKNYDFFAISNPTRNPDVGVNLRLMMSTYNLSALVILRDFLEPVTNDPNGPTTSGDHIE